VRCLDRSANVGVHSGNLRRGTGQCSTGAAPPAGAALEVEELLCNSRASLEPTCGVPGGSQSLGRPSLDSSAPTDRRGYGRSSIVAIATDGAAHFQPVESRSGLGWNSSGVQVSARRRISSLMA
jgi:hypothetical protein